MIKEMREFPYFDDYDSKKQYTQLLAVPGRVAQAREITQMQSVLKDIIKSIGDSIMKDGNIIEGCQVIIDESKQKATITIGKVYLNGMVLPVHGLDSNGNPVDIEVPILGVGTETIGFKLIERIVDESGDSTLRDPAQGYDNFNQPGCHRLKSEVRIVKDDPDSATLVTLIDGAVSVEKYAPNYDVMTQTLARRTYDESGSYIVEGLNTRIEEHPESSDKVRVIVESGKAYVLGYELKIPSSRRLDLDRSIDYITVTPTPSYSAINEYILSTGEYVRQINSVYGVRTATKTNMERPNSDQSTQTLQLDSDSEFNEIKSIYDSTHPNGYIAGVDYIAVLTENVATITWRGNDYPRETYSIEYDYYHHFVEGKDYELRSSEGMHILGWVPGGDTPKVGGSMKLSYDLYLARKDVIYIDHYGNISIVKGIPAQYGLETFPEAPINTLPLSHIYHLPGGDHRGISVSNVGLTRFTMNDIQNLLKRVRSLEYNQVLSSLLEDTKQRTVIGTRKGIFTDPLVDFSKVDYHYNRDGDVKVDPQLPAYDATIDFWRNLCYLPSRVNTYDLSYSEESSTHKQTRLATLGKLDNVGTVVLSQMNATKSFLINPYSTFPQLPEMYLTPAVDSWIEPNYIEVAESRENPRVVATSTRHTESTTYRGTIFDTYSTSSETYSDTAIGTTVDIETSESIISDTAATYIRSRTLEISGSNFPPQLNNIRCYFDGVIVPIYPTGATTSGDEIIEGAERSLGTGTVKATADGKVTALLPIPENRFLTGIREVRLETSIDGYDDGSGSAFALYQASGTVRTIQRTITTINNVLLERVTTVHTTTFIDPVGQTFVLDRMTLISGIDLYFEAKPQDNTPVTCDIREVVDGTITSTIYGHKTLSASEVHTSSDSRTATRFVFDDPVLLEENKEYAFVVRSTSPSYRIWVADLGGTDIVSGDTVLSNPYLIGVMMSSSNNSSWTAHQTTDVKFRLIADNYSTNSELVLSNITVEQFSKIYLLADSIVPEGTAIHWYYSLDGGSTYNNISPYNVVVRDSMHDKISVKAALSRGANPNISPLVAVDTICASLSSYDTEGTYLSIEFPGYSSSSGSAEIEGYDRVDIILDVYTPSDSQKLAVYVSSDNGDTLVPAGVTRTEYMSQGWSEVTYTAEMPRKSAKCKVIIDMSSTNHYQTPAFRRLRAITYNA